MIPGGATLTFELELEMIIKKSVTEELAMGVKTVTCSSCAGVGWESRKCSFLDDRVCTACTMCMACATCA